MTLAVLDRTSIAGRWRLYARAPGRTPVEITLVRGQPTVIESFSWEDPFGPKQLTLSFEQISALDAWGYGDLDWLVPDVDIDLVWDGELPEQYPTGYWLSGSAPPAFTPGPLLPPRPGPNYRWVPVARWEGFVPSLDAQKTLGKAGISLTAVGGLRMLDGYLAKPEYLARPLPYEWAIARQFLDKPALRLANCRVAFPAWWDRFYEAKAGVAAYLVPSGVQHGQPWTAFLTRDTGTFNPALTSYIQQMLTAMYTERGRFTLDLLPGRVPLLSHRDIYSSSQTGFLVIDLVDPGVNFSMKVDNAQSLGAVYGRARSQQGTSYTGRQVSPDGSSSSYLPLAELPQVRQDDARGWLDTGKVRREIMLQLQDGITAAEMIEAGRQHLARFADPGLTGSLDIGSTVGIINSDGSVGRLHHMLIRHGMSAVLKGWQGRPATVVHITDVNVSMTNGRTSATVDSKYRDSLTVGEVTARTRDALAVPRMMLGGEYQPPIPDSLVPWNYAEGSGYLPSGSTYSSLYLLRDVPRSMVFPWETWTRSRPPSDPNWRYCYAHIGPASTVANDNWAGVTDSGGVTHGLPVRLAQAGQINLLQLAAYRANGSVFPVEFHVSFYTNGGVNYQAMPVLTEAEAIELGRYAGGQHYPFGPSGWEKFNPDGTESHPLIPHATDTAGLLKTYGTYYERPGHFPGKEIDPVTGLLVDEVGFSFDLTQVTNAFAPYSPTGNWSNPLAGIGYVMIYCDAQGADDVYFAGRMFRAEPGTS